MRNLSESIEQPAPTAWPMVTALGITLVFAGLVTHMLVSLVGIALTLVAAVGWWGQALPEPHLEHLVVPLPAEAGAPFVPERPTVGRPAIGEAGHRTRVPLEVQPLSAGVKGGIAGGAAMAAVAIAYGILLQHSLWYPINLLAAIAMPGMAQASEATLHAFHPAALILGIVIHGGISVLTGLLYALILPMLPRRHMLWGGFIAPLLWTGGLWALLGVINPVLDARVDWTWFIISQIVFGLAAGYVVSRVQPVATMQTWPLAARAGVEMSGGGGPRGSRQ
jgi:hypothetical protein